MLPASHVLFGANGARESLDHTLVPFREVESFACLKVDTLAFSC